jgi:hypothetical protein
MHYKMFRDHKGLFFFERKRIPGIAVQNIGIFWMNGKTPQCRKKLVQYRLKVQPTLVSLAVNPAAEVVRPYIST